MLENLEVRESGEMGRGIFTRQPIQRGAEILKFDGRIITLEEILRRPASMECYPLQIGNGLYLDIQPPESLVNHSCAPNAGILNDTWLVAMEDIPRGAQIFYDYSTTMLGDSWRMNCRCGTPGCRGVVGEFTDLPVEAMRKYLELWVVQTFIRQSIGERLSALERRGIMPRDETKNASLRQLWGR